jgi:asparagine synthase (glutamine-hydrolysing)
LQRRNIQGLPQWAGRFYRQHLHSKLPYKLPARNLAYSISLPWQERYLEGISLQPFDRELSLLSGNFRNSAIGAPDPMKTFRAYLDDAPAHDAVDRVLYLDTKTYLPGDILTKVDRMSMANSLEARVPLLDHPLVEFACSLPSDLRFRDGNTKYLLKRALDGHVPAETLSRPKQGFAVPLESWFSGSVPGFFRDELTDTSWLAGVGIQRAELSRLLDRFAATRRRDYCDRLWALVVLNRAVRRLLGPTP